MPYHLISKQFVCPRVENFPSNYSSFIRMKIFLWEARGEGVALLSTVGPDK